MNLLDISTRKWSPSLLDATATNLESKLGAVSASHGRIRFFVNIHLSFPRFAPEADSILEY
jgi:hypothetical protein